MVDAPMVSPSDEDRSLREWIIRRDGDLKHMPEHLDGLLARHRLSAQPSAPVGWSRWHGSTAAPPKDWNGAECMLGDGTWGIPRGCDWGPFNENMVAFYPVLTSPQPSLELLDIPQSERGHPLGKLWSEAFHAWEEKGHWAACEILARYIAAQPSLEVMTFARAILHGEERHRAWLLDAARAFEAGEELPPCDQVTTPSTPPEPQHSLDVIETKAFKLLAALHDALVLSCEYTQGETVEEITKRVPAFKEASAFLLRSINHHYDEIEGTTPSTPPEPEDDLVEELEKVAQDIFYGRPIDQWHSDTASRAARELAALQSEIDAAERIEALERALKPFAYVAAEGDEGKDPSTIAGELSEAMRADILGAEETMRGQLQFWSAHRGTAKAVLKRGLIEGLDYKNSGFFTPLGLAVRKHLEQKP